MRITVFGKPVTQGSFIRTRYSMRSSNSETLKPWRDNVRTAALENGGRFFARPVAVSITFTFARPASHSGTGRNAGTVKSSAPPFPSGHGIGDIDKLVRACLDSLTEAGTFTDDSQVVQLTASKIYVGVAGALDRPGAVVDVTAARDVTRVRAARSGVAPITHGASHSREAL